MKITLLTKQNQNKLISETLKVLLAGGVVIAPTDTVYGALVDATNKKAVEKLIQFKERPAGKPISIFVEDFKMMEKYVDVTKDQRATLKNILPGAFTTILKSKGKVSSLLESENGTLGVRYIRYTYIEELVRRFGKPVTATSANLSGKGSSYDVLSLLKTLSQKKKAMIDLVIDAGKLPQNKPSTVIDLTLPEIKVIRPGDAELSKGKTFISNSSDETKKIAKELLTDVIARSEATKQSSKPIIFILEGDLGVGKTIFVKGIGDFLGIKDIISPTFVVYYEYDMPKFQETNSKKQINPKSKFVHIDLYNLEREEEFKHLGLEKYLVPGNILCIEWGEKSGSILNLLKERGEVIFVTMEYLDETMREISFGAQ